MSGKLPLIIDGGQVRQIARHEAIDENVIVEDGDGVLALRLVRLLILELTLKKFPLSTELLEQLSELED